MRSIKLIVICIALALFGVVYLSGSAQTTSTPDETKACCTKQEGKAACCAKHEGKEACCAKHEGKEACGESCQKHKAHAGEQSCCAGGGCCQNGSCGTSCQADKGANCCGEGGDKAAGCAHHKDNKAACGDSCRKNHTDAAKGENCCAGCACCGGKTAQ